MNTVESRGPDSPSNPISVSQNHSAMLRASPRNLLLDLGLESFARTPSRDLRGPQIHGGPDPRACLPFNGACFTNNPGRAPYHVPMRADILIAGIIVLVCGYAVYQQFAYNPLGDDEIKPIAIGEKLDLDVRLTDVSDVPATVAVGDYTGRRFTVLYSWSVPCPCVSKLEPRLRAVHMRFNEHDNGVAWLALAGEPKDTRESLRAQMFRLHAFYKLLRDPQQQVLQQLGFGHAVQVAIIDDEGRLLYRGAVDDNYEEGKAEWLEEALAAAVKGQPIPRPETPYTYGCAFNDPASCEEYKEREAPAPATGEKAAVKTDQ